MVIEVMAVMEVIALTARMARTVLREVIRLIAITSRNLNQIRLLRIMDSSADVTHLILLTELLHLVHLSQAGNH